MGGTPAAAPSSDDERPRSGEADRSRPPVLPRPLTSFVGRAREIDDLCDLLLRADARLVTLTGPGGVGKTRLAIEVAARLANSLPDGARLASLAEIRDVALVGVAISRARFGPAMGRVAAQDPVSAFQTFDGLLVVDNVEHVLDAAPLLSRMLAECPGLTVLATSRVMLNLMAERVVVVAPLDTPAVATSGTGDWLMRLPAVRLFAERARARGGAFALTRENAATIAGICAAVDGLPLAIELAAVHTDVLAPDAILARLAGGLPLPDRAPVDSPARHRTTRNAVAWSYDLLEARVQTALRQLSVCVGSFDFDTAAAVLGDGIDPLDAVGALVSSSLLNASPSPRDEMRYAMLETVREFGLARLAEGADGVAMPADGRGRAPEETAARDRHAAHFLSVAEWSDWAWFMSPEEGERRLARLEVDAPNIRAALGWYRERYDRHSLMRMVSSLGGLWIVLGHPREGQRWLEDGLRDGHELPAAIRAKALAILSWCLNTQGDPGRALELAEESLTLWRSLDDPLHTVQALVLSGVPAYRLPDHHDHATARIEEAMALLETIDTPDWVPNVTVTLTGQLGQIALIRGDIELAERRYDAAREMELARGVGLGESHIYGANVPIGLGEIARARGDARRALALYQAGLRSGWRHHNYRAIAFGLGGVAGALAAMGNHDAAARLFGADEALHEVLGYDFARETYDRQRAVGLPEPWLRARDSFGDHQALRDALRDQPAPPSIRNPAIATQAWTEGRRLALETAIAQALAARPPEPAPARSTAAPFGLSPREVDVLRLLADGMTDAEIADTLFISRRTAATHIRHIYDKLDISSRAEAAAWAVRNGVA